MMLPTDEPLYASQSGNRRDTDRPRQSAGHSVERKDSANLRLVAGALFGSGLAISGMTDPARVIGFLDILGHWEPALLFVMGGAVGVYGLGMLILRCLKIRELPTASSSPIDRRLMLGAAIFGLGWGLGGFCPGPALANLGALQTEGLIFVPAKVVTLAKKISCPRFPHRR